jgi:hypothetical protein
VRTRRSTWILLGAAIALAALTVGCEDAPTLHPLPLDLSGESVDPFSAHPGRVAVFLFVGTECPISNRYAPEIQRLHAKFSPRDVAFWLVYPDPDESSEDIREHLRAFGHEAEVLRDPQHALVDFTGAEFTPEAAVFDSLAQIVYRGRIDDRFVDFGKTRPAPTVRDLERALEATLSGEDVATARTRAIGCFIADTK